MYLILGADGAEQLNVTNTDSGGHVVLLEQHLDNDDSSSVNYPNPLG